jgi:hypothetical protein
MKSISSNNNNKERCCRYGCGKLIKWDKSRYAYIEIDTNIRHRCPNWNSKQEYPVEVANRSITAEQQLYIDTIGPTIVEILSLLFSKSERI